MQLQYGQLHTLSAAPGVPYAISYQLNNIFQPLWPSGGHRPRYYNSIVGFGYLKYIVVGAEIEVMFTPGIVASNFQETPMLSQLYLDGNGSAGPIFLDPDLAESDEMVGSTLKLVNPGPSHPDAYKVSRRVNVRQLLGYGGSEEEYIADESYWSPITSGPTTGVFATIRGEPTAPYLSTANQEFAVKISFDVVFAGRNSVAPS
jgi:hypothetical protein